jgi:hypothetical protein
MLVLLLVLICRSFCKYKYETDGGITACFGWEGDLNAPIAFIDGSYKLRSFNNAMIVFGVEDVTQKIKWYNAEGYLPAFISEYAKDDFIVKVENFADLLVVGENNFEIAYSRMTVTNNGKDTKPLPVVSKELIPLTSNPDNIDPGSTIVRDYAVPADRFSFDYDWPSSDVIKNAGSYDSHYDHMKTYWNERLSKVVNIVALPDPSLINAYKAGFIYTLIIGDDIRQDDGTIRKYKSNL